MSAAAGIIARDAGATLSLDAEILKYQLEWALSKAAKSLPYFTSDDMWKFLESIGVNSLDHPNALGGMFLQARKAGIIEPTGRVFKSIRTSAHRRNVQCWHSLIFPRPETHSETR